MKDKYLVHEIAEYYGVTCDTIRYYDKLGIISPKKDKNNNYRYYNRSDIICFSYVFKLKNLGLQLDQVKTLLNNSSLEYVYNTLEGQEKLIEDKINNLHRLKSIINDYRRCFNYSVENFEKIKIINNSPIIIYKEIEDTNGSVIENMKLFNKLTLIHEPLYTFCIDKGLFLSKKFYNNMMECRKFFKCGLSLIDEEDLILKSDFPLEEFRILNTNKVLTSVIKFYTNKDYSSILKIRDYIVQNNLEIEHSIYLRAISFKNNIKDNYDYYIVYIPLK